MFSITEISKEYERIARIVIAGRHAEAEKTALALRHALATEPGLSHIKRCVENLLAQIARHTSRNGNS